MSETEQIKTHDFVEAKNKIKEFTDDPPKNKSLKRFETKDGPFHLFDHNVTGEELNEFIVKIQAILNEFVETDRKFIDEFKDVYDAFESLDNDYIQGILIGVKSAESASQEAKDAQKDIDKTIKNLEATIEALQKFKKEVKTNKHLHDIDRMWNELEEVKAHLDIVGHSKKLEITKRVKIAVVMSGTAIALAVLDLALNLTGVI